MRREHRLWLAIILLIIFLAVVVIVIILSQKSHQTILVGSWNLQVFGDKKASDEVALIEFIDVIEQYDVMFLQEIRDSDGSSIALLCSRIKNMTCRASSRAGRTSSKEQYVVVVRNGIEVLDWQDHSPNDRWERPPLEFVIGVQNSTANATIRLFGIHVKPTDVANELTLLEQIAFSDAQKEPVLVLGDLNADCGYYQRNNQHFASWAWLIPDNADTTTGRSNCAYDRIIANDIASREIFASGVHKANITEELTDHYPVWARVIVDQR